MARLDLLRRVLTGTNNTASPMNGALMQSVLGVDGAQFDLFGDEILVWRQTGAVARTITFVAVADDSNRVLNQTVSVAGTAGHVGSFGPIQAKGWRQSTGKFHIDVSGDGIDMMVLTRS